MPSHIIGKQSQVHQFQVTKLKVAFQSILRLFAEVKKHTTKMKSTLVSIGAKWEFILQILVFIFILQFKRLSVFSFSSPLLEWPWQTPLEESMMVLAFHLVARGRPNIMDITTHTTTLTTTVRTILNTKI